MFKSRKYLLVLLAEIAGIVALFCHDMTGTEFVSLVSVLNISYHTANVVDSYNDGKRRIMERLKNDNQP